ncbi:MAG: HlyD family efflux transporter periplasmic adaptor subunit [Oscillospiraceae bacterium]
MKLLSADKKMISDSKLIGRIRQLFKKTGEKNSDSVPDLSSDPKKKKQKKKRIIIAVVSTVVIIGGVIAWKAIGSSKSSGSANTTYTASVVAKRNISNTLSSSGTLEPAQSYSVTSLVSGEILTSDFEKGDAVTKGQTLYQIDTTDAETSIASAKLNVEKAQLSYDKVLETMSNLSVSAPVAGTITALNVEVGDSVQSGSAIGTIKNSATMSLSVPFNSADVDSFYIGESATVTLDSTFETLNGTVSKISATEQVLTGNMLVKYVTIEVSNPGGITDSTSATASIGDVACNSSANFAYKSSQTITAKTSGTVESIVHDEGDSVSKGTVIVKLSSDDISGNITSARISLEDAENSLADKEKALEDYTITSPIDGTVITKDYKAGDKLGSSSGGSSSSTSLCTIYDLSYLTMEMSIDELDIGEVAVGQSVTITADAVDGKTFTGTVTSISIKGTTSNSVTAYPVTVQIDDTDGLLPGMNVTANIVVKSVTDALSIPVDAVSRGNKVLVKENGSSAVTDGQALETGKDGIPDGYKYVEVTLGINDDDYIEVDSGLNEGDVVAVVTVNTDTGTTNAAGFGGMTGGGGGNMGGGSGGPPSGGGGGGGPMGG